MPSAIAGPANNAAGAQVSPKTHVESDGAKCSPSVSPAAPLAPLAVSEAPAQFRNADEARLEWVCERLFEHSMYIRSYQSHDLPHGGFAFYNNSTLICYGDSMIAAIDAALRKEKG